MLFRSIIENCDSLFPNMFTDIEKMDFCNELAAIINANYIKNTRTLALSGSSDCSLPDSVSADRVVAVYFDGVLQPGTNVANLLSASGGHKVTVEYIHIPTYNLDDKVPLSAPYDKLFLYWLLAKICLHLEDAEGYNNYMNLYNALLVDYKKGRIERGNSRVIKFKNLY